MEAKKSLAAALIALGVCSATSADKLLENMTSAEAASILPGLKNLKIERRLGAFALTARPTWAPDDADSMTSDRSLA